MIRVIFLHGLLFLLPFIAYALFIIIRKRGSVRDRSQWSNDALTWLTLGGLSLAIVSFIVLGVFGGAPAESVYVPSRYEDGRIVPGGFLEPGEEPTAAE
ncbi:MAG: DUF6111 family protein [Pseudomonadota bacterium]